MNAVFISYTVEAKYHDKIAIISIAFPNFIFLAHFNG